MTTELQCPYQRILWYLLGLAMLLTQQASRASEAINSETLIMVEGSTKAVRFPVDADLQVSRKGIIDLIWLSDNQWQITALRRGTVMIRGVDGNRQPVATTVVNVTSQAQQRNDRFNYLADICRLPGLKCENQTRRLTGHIASWSDYLYAFSRCHNLKTCLFAVSLDPQGLSQLKQDWQQTLGIEITVKQLLGGQILVQLPCEFYEKQIIKTQLKTLGGQALTHGKLFLSCTPPSHSLKLAAKVFFLNQGDAEQLGVTWSNFKSLDDAHLKAFLSKNHSRIMSDPVITVAPHLPFDIHAGGEIKVISQSDKPEEHWRSTGVSLSGKIMPLAADEYVLDFNLKISSPQEDGNRLISSHVNSQAKLKIGQSAVVGEINTQFSVEGSGNVPILSDIPLIWPLFSFNHQSHGQVKVILWVKIEAQQKHS